MLGHSFQLFQALGETLQFLRLLDRDRVGPEIIEGLQHVGNTDLIHIERGLVLGLAVVRFSHLREDTALHEL